VGSTAREEASKGVYIQYVPEISDYCC
jgi:hypothetical protein